MGATSFESLKLMPCPTHPPLTTTCNTAGVKHPGGTSLSAPLPRSSISQPYVWEGRTASDTLAGSEGPNQRNGGGATSSQERRKRHRSSKRQTKAPARNQLDQARKRQGT